MSLKEVSTNNLNIWSKILSVGGLLIIFAIFLFIRTTQIQFSCFPMVTGGNLPIFCSNLEMKEKIIGNPRTHGITVFTMAKDPNQNSGILEKIYETKTTYVEDDREKIINILSQNSKTPESVLLDLANTNNSSDTLSVLARLKNSKVLKTLLSNPNATKDPIVVGILCNNPVVNQVIPDAVKTCHSMIKEIAKNPETQEKELLVLAELPDLDLLRTLAKNQSILKYSTVIERLTSNTVINKELAKNTGTSENILSKLAKSEDLNILDVVLSNDSVINYYSSVKEKLCNNPVIQKEKRSVCNITTSLEETIRIAKNPNTPEKELVILSGSEEQRVLEALLSNPNVEKYPKVIERLCNNPQIKKPSFCPVIITKSLEEIILIAKDPSTSEPKLLELADDSNFKVLEALLSNPNFKNYPRLKEKLCSNPVIQKELKTKLTGENLIYGAGIGIAGGVLLVLTAPVWLPAGAALAPLIPILLSAGLFGGSTVLLEFLTKCN